MTKCENWHDLLHEIKNKEYSKIEAIEKYIENVCKRREPLHCAEIFMFAGIECPEELVGFGWGNPYSLYLDGYFYSYRGGLDVDWHIEFPQPYFIGEQE